MYEYRNSGIAFVRQVFSLVIGSCPRDRIILLEFARVERHVVRARIEQALGPKDRPTACSPENTGIAEVHHGG